MGKKLTAPGDRTSLADIMNLELFRFTFRNANDKREGCVGMMANRHTLLMFRKDGTIGSMTSCSPHHFEFIDYLLKTDSVTIVGGADDEDQIPPVDNRVFAARDVPANVAEIPDYVPFMSRYKDARQGKDWPSMWVRRAGMHSLISFDPTGHYGSNNQGFGGECHDTYTSDDQPHSGRTRKDASRAYTFVGWIDPAEWMPRFERHQLFVPA